MSIYVLYKSVSIFTHLKEISFFLCRLNLTATVRALAIYKLRLGPKRLTRCAVHSFVRTLIYITLVI